LLNPSVARTYQASRYRHLRDFPRSLILEVTSRCNLACRICARQFMARPAQDMEAGLFRSLVDQIAPHDGRDAVDLVALHWFGESLLHPQLLEFIAYAGRQLPNLLRRGPQRNAVRGLNLSTNATVLTPELAQGLLDSPLSWLAVSVDGSSAETYADMRGGDFAEVIANVERLLELNRASPRELPTIAVQVIVTETTRAELEACRERWDQHLRGAPNARLELKPYNDWGGQVEAPDLQPPDPRGGFFYLNCGYLWDTMAIGAGGEVGLCCYDVNACHDLGNAREIPLYEIWHSPQLKHLRRLHSQGRLRELPLCRNCRMGRKYPGDYLPWKRR
jgi:MoaA/NifB/PqqE/SkfB family radical SAM enzyme